MNYERKNIYRHLKIQQHAILHHFPDMIHAVMIRNSTIIMNIIQHHIRLLADLNTSNLAGKSERSGAVGVAV